MAITLSTSGAFVSGTTAVDNDSILRVDTAAGAETVTLPSGTYNGFKFQVIREGVNAVTLQAAAGETLNGVGSLAVDLDLATVSRLNGEWFSHVQPTDAATAV